MAVTTVGFIYMTLFKDRHSLKKGSSSISSWEVLDQELTLEQKIQN